MWGYICPELLQAIDSEPESDVAAEMYESLGKVNILIPYFILKLIVNFVLLVHRVFGSRMLIRQMDERSIANFRKEFKCTF